MVWAGPGKGVGAKGKGVGSEGGSQKERSGGGARGKGSDQRAGPEPDGRGGVRGRSHLPAPACVPQLCELEAGLSEALMPTVWICGSPSLPSLHPERRRMMKSGSSSDLAEQLKIPQQPADVLVHSEWR